MGTDIHPVVQVRRGGVWESVSDRGPRDSHNWPIIENRCYALFAVLADVRNGFGFAGVKTGEPVTPIASYRGLPGDFTPPDEDNEQWLGDWGHTWVTLAELEDYPWAASRTRTGIISWAQFQEWDGQGPPRGGWSGGISGGNIVTISTEEARGLVSPPDGVKVYVQVEWTETIAASVGAFHADVLPWLRSLGGRDDVRIVMGFDS